MGARSGRGASGGMGARAIATASGKKTATSQEGKLNAFLARSEHGTGEIFSTQPKNKMQNKLHNMMYSGGVETVNANVSMNLNDLIPTQSKVWSSHVSKYIKSSGNDEAPIVATYKGKNYIIDGHHRLAADILTGKKTAKVKQFVMK